MRRMASYAFILLLALIFVSGCDVIGLTPDPKPDPIPSPDPGPEISVGNFVSVWKPSNALISSHYVYLPLVSSGNYDFTIDWGDGTSGEVTSWNDLDARHYYANESNSYEVTINGIIEGIGFNDVDLSDPLQLLEIKEFGPLRLGNQGNYFSGARNMVITAEDDLDLTGTTTLIAAFMHCDSLTSVPSMPEWDISTVTDISFMFCGADNFNGDISGWDVSEVTTMRNMFELASAFNQDISSWKTGKVTTMSDIFSGATSFDADITGWDVSAVTVLDNAFRNASAFEANIGAWNVSKVTTMQNMLKSLKLPTATYDGILIGWAGLPELQPNVKFDAGESEYTPDSAAADARAVLEGLGWAITDGGAAP